MRRNPDALLVRRALLFALGVAWPFFLFGKFGIFGKPSVDDPSMERRIASAQGREPTLTPEEAAMLEKVNLLVQTNLAHAQSMLEELVGRDVPTTPAFNHALGNLYLKIRKFPEAEEQFLKSIAQMPDYRNAWNDLGNLKYIRNDFEGAIEALSKSVELGATDAGTYGMLAYCHLEKENFTAAGIAYDLAIVTDAENRNWLEGKAHLLSETGHPVEARAVLHELIRRFPDNAAYWFMHANTWLATDDSLKAARDLEIARIIGEIDAEAVFLLGNIYLNNGIPDRAAEAYLEALEIAPISDAGLALKVASQLLYRGESGLAQAVFEKVNSAGLGSDADVQSRYITMQAEFARERGNEALATELLKEALEVDPLNGSILIKLAQLYIDASERSKAVYALERVQGYSADEYNALMLLSKLYIEEENYRKTSELLQRAMEIYPSEQLNAYYVQVKARADRQNNL